MPITDVLVYQVETDIGERDLVSLLEPEWVTAHGLCPEAIVGFVRDGFEENPAFLRFLSRVVYEEIGNLEHLRLQAHLLESRLSQSSLWARRVDPVSGANYIIFRTGYGDGHYPVWIGRSASGGTICFTMDTLISRRM